MLDTWNSGGYFELDRISIIISIYVQSRIFFFSIYKPECLYVSLYVCMSPITGERPDRFHSHFQDTFVLSGVGFRLSRDSIAQLGAEIGLNRYISLPNSPIVSNATLKSSSWPDESNGRKKLPKSIELFSSYEHYKNVNWVRASIRHVVWPEIYLQLN